MTGFIGWRDRWRWPSRYRRTCLFGRRVLLGRSGWVHGPCFVGVFHGHLLDALREETLQVVVLLFALVGLGCPVVYKSDAGDLGLEQFLGTTKAWADGAVDGAPLNGDSKPCCSNQRVLFGMHTNAKVIAFACREVVGVGTAVTPTLRAVGHACWRAVVACGNDPAFEHDDRADLPANAVGALAYCQCDAHEIGVRRKSAIGVFEGHAAVVSHGERRCQ